MNPTGTWLCRSVKHVMVNTGSCLGMTEKNCSLRQNHKAKQQLHKKILYFSESLIEYTQDFICSVSLGYDVVPRLGILELKNLKIDILEAIKNCPLPKVTGKT